MGRERKVIWKWAVVCMSLRQLCMLMIIRTLMEPRAWVKAFPAVSCSGAISFAVPKVTILPFRDSQNHLGWERPLSSWGPATAIAVPPSPPSHVPKCHILVFSEHFQGWRFHSIPEHPVPVPDHPFSDVFPTTQSNQCLCLCYLWRGSCSDTQVLQPLWCLHHPDQAPPCCGSSSTASLGWLWGEKINALAFTEYFNACWASNHCVVLLFLSEQ